MSFFKKILILFSMFSTFMLFGFNETPNEAYENYLYAIKAGDLKDLIKYSNPDVKLTEEEFASALPSMQIYIPTNIQYTKEIVVDNLALLYTKGDFYNPHTKNEEICDGVIKLNKIENVWKIKRNYWRCVINKEG